MIVENIKKAEFIKFKDIIELAEGRCIAVIGKNGYGKTTLLRLLSGNLFPDSGKIHINNLQYSFPMKIFNRPKYQKEMRKKIMYIENQNYLYSNFTVFQNIKYLMSLGKFNKSIFESVLDEFDFFEKYFSTNVKELSLGTKQKISLALVFSSSRSIILVDEPTLGLDIDSRNTLLNLMQKYKESKCIIFSTNDQTILNSFDLFLLCENDEVKVLYDNPYNKSRD